MGTEYENLLVDRTGDVVTITLNRPDTRNSLSRALMLEMQHALDSVGESDALGLIIAANGPVFSAGHNFGDMVNVELPEARSLLEVCTRMMNTVQEIPQVVIAKVHALATAAGCQLVATCDMAIGAESSAYALPGGKGGLFCNTPLVAVARQLSRKHALELAITGDPVDAQTAASWGLINRVVADDQLSDAVNELMARSIRGSAMAKGIGKRAYYAQVDMEQPKAYAYAMEVMAAGIVTPDAQEGIGAFFEKRRPTFTQRAR